MNNVTQKDGFYISKNPMVNETALCFDGRYWIVDGVVDDFDECKTLEEAKEIYRKSERKGTWSDYEDGE